MELKDFEKFFPAMAIGDALAATTQGLKPARIHQTFGLVDDFVESDAAPEPSPHNWRLKGLYSFPTQQALAVAESLILSDGYDLKNIYESLLYLYAEDGGLFRGMDEAFRKAMKNRKPEDDPLSYAVCLPGIGCFSRCLPFALYFRNDEEAMIRATLETCLLTNNDPRAIAGAAACVRAAALLIHDPESSSRDPSKFLDDVRRFTRKCEERLQDIYGRFLLIETPVSRYYAVSDSLQVLPLCLKEKNRDLVKKTILTEANRRQPPFPISGLNQDFAPSAACFILYTLIRSKTFAAGVLDVINEGKESRAMGAVIAGLLCLRFGSSGIPEEWERQIKGLSDLILRGKELREGYPDWNERRDLAEIEREYTQIEKGEIEKRTQAFLKDKEKEEKKRPQKIKQPTAINPKLPPQEDAAFAPPPSIVFGSELPDPLKVKKEKALRGKRRIEWKENRRKSGKDGK